MRAVPYNYILDTTHAFLISIFHTIFKSKPQDPLSPKQTKQNNRTEAEFWFRFILHPRR